MDGGLDYDSIDLARLRTYTVRAFDEATHEVTVDFVVHDGGVAASWAKQAKPGDKVRLNSPTALYDPPEGLEWQVLVPDLAGLPALARLVEQSHWDVATRVVVEVPSDEDRIELPPHPRCTVTWVVGGNGHGASRLGELVESLRRPAGVGYVWVAGESAALRAVRRHLRQELKLPSTAFKTIGYWIDHVEEWQSPYRRPRRLDARRAEGALEPGGEHRRHRARVRLSARRSRSVTQTVRRVTGALQGECRASASSWSASP